VAHPDDPTDRPPGDPPPDDDRTDPYDPELSDQDTQVLGVARVPDRTPGEDEEYTGYGDDVEPEYPEPEYAEPPRIEPSELAGLQGGGGGQVAVRRVLPLEDEASTLVARYLFPTERYRGEWRRHIIHLTGPISIGVAATIGLGWLSGLLARGDGSLDWLSGIMALAWFGVMGWVVWQFADWHFDRFILTNKRVMKVSGIITRNVAMMPLLRVTDMKYEQSPLGRMLNYGTFVLESAGQDQALREVPHLPNPNELYLRVVEEMYEPAAVEARVGRTPSEEEEEQRVGDS
jgi:membrane protein YdbS with pleckstrin-like domain